MTNDHHVSIAKKACTRCSTQKRRCDRALPGCGLCTRLHQSCIYDLPRISSSGPTPSPSPRPEISLLSSGAFTASHLNDAIIQRIGHYTPGDIFSAYCLEIEPWFPIISVSRLRDRLPLTWNEAPLGISLLCVSIVLLTTTPPTSPEDENDPSEFKSRYLFAKTCIASTEGFGINSCLTIQSRILVTLFEVAHGLYPAAFISIGALVRAADALVSHPGGEMCLRQLDDDEKRQEKVLTWCGILILDRYIAIDSGPQTSLTCSRAETIQDLFKPIFCRTHEANQDRSDPICRLSRLLEASILLDKINTGLNSLIEEHRFNMDELILTVQTSVNLQTILNEEIGDGIHIYSGGLVLCNLALVLAFENGSKVPYLAGVTEDCNSLATTSLISVVATIASTVEPFVLGTQTIEFNLLPPFITFLVYKAAEIVTERLLINIHSNESLQQLKVLRKFLNIVGKRWLGCERYIRLLNEDTTPRLLKAVEQG